MIEPPQAVLSADHQTVTLRRGEWAEVFAVALLPSRLAFYASLAALKPGDRLMDREAIYGPVVAALKEIQAQMAAAEKGCKR